MKKNKSSSSEKKVTFVLEQTKRDNSQSPDNEIKQSARFPDVQVQLEPPVEHLKKPKKVVKLDSAKQEEIKQKKASFSELVQNESSLANAISEKVDKLLPTPG